MMIGWDIMQMLYPELPEEFPGCDSYNQIKPDTETGQIYGELVDCIEDNGTQKEKMFWLHKWAKTIE